MPINTMTSKVRETENDVPNETLNLPSMNNKNMRISYDRPGNISESEWGVNRHRGSKEIILESENDVSKISKKDSHMKDSG